MAPELCAEVEYDEKVDVWSSGVILYILITGQPPFIGKNKDQIYINIQREEPNYKMAQLKKCDPSLVDFLKKCLAKEPSDRPQVYELLEHPWVQLANEDDNIDNAKRLDISANLAAFRKTTVFQSGVLSFITNIQVQSDQLKDLKEMFISLDKNKDGMLSQSELENGMSEILTFFNIDEEELRQMVEAIDTNQDGFIDYQEFVTAAYNRQQALSEKNLKAAFDAFDNDGNGQISMDELKAIFGRGEASMKNETIW